MKTKETVGLPDNVPCMAAEFVLNSTKPPREGVPRDSGTFTMLNASSPNQTPELALFSAQAPDPSLDLVAPCPVSKEFLQVFEQLTGWQAKFFESSESQQRRETVATDSDLPLGSFQVVDMSAAWPAQTPTAHRGRCDKLMDLFGHLVHELQSTRMELNRASSALEAISPDFTNGETELVDAFIPKFSASNNPAPSLNRRSTDVPQDNRDFLYDSVDLNLEADFVVVDEGEDEGFVVQQEVSSPVVHPDDIWESWTFGGTTGLADDVYLDWFPDKDVLTVCVGRIESSYGNGDSEVSIEINARTNAYRVRGDVALDALFVWDRRGGKLLPVDTSGEWITMWPGSAIIASTTTDIVGPDPQAELSLDPNAEQFARVLRRDLSSQERVLVIKRF